jgi:hypothetical protein
MAAVQNEPPFAVNRAARFAHARFFAGLILIILANAGRLFREPDRPTVPPSQTKRELVE